MKPQLLIVLSICCSWSLLASAQQPSNLDQLQAKERLNAKLREEEEQRKKAVEMKMQRGTEDRVGAKRDAARTYFASENELPPAEKKLLTNDPDEEQKYQDLLRQPQTGLFKLLNYQETKAGLADAKSQFAYPHLRGGGAFYSFAKRNHLADEWAQICLQNGILQAAYTEMKRTTVVQSGGAPQNFAYTSGYGLALFTSLGDVALAEVSPQLPAIQMLAEWPLPTHYQEFFTQVKQSKAGLQIGPHWYHATIPSQVNETYVVRSVNYKKADVVIVFRIVRQDADGNLHILWKQLKSLPPVELKGKKP